MAPYTLSQIATVLGEPQHRLLHLCEKRVIIPDLTDAHGRGSSRQFSSKNVFEFAVAFELRALEVPVAAVKQWIRALDQFSRALESRRPVIKVPDDLLHVSAPQITLTLVDAAQLVLTVGDPAAPDLILEGPKLSASGTARRDAPRRLSRSEALRLTGQAHTLLELELTRIAHGLASRLGELD